MIRPPADTGSAQPALHIVPAGGVPLGPEQRTFNDLVARLAALRTELSEWRAFEDRYAREVMGKLLPLEAQYRDARRGLILQCEAILAGQRGGGVAGAAERRKLIKTLVETCAVHLSESPEDAAILRLHDAHATAPFAEREPGMARNATGSGEPIEGDAPSSDRGSAKSTGDPWDAADLAHLRAQDAREQARRRRRDERRRRGEAERAAADRSARVPSPSVREVFRKLASALHPDRAQDESERARRNELMQRVNGAYDARDLLTLLTLQLEIEQIDAGHLAAAAPAGLQRYNQVLREQAADLERELREVEAHFARLLGDAGRRVTRRSAERELRRAIAEVRQDLAELRDLTLAILDPALRRQWLES